MSTRDNTPISVRCAQWEYCAVPSGMHLDVKAGKLKKEHVYTYYVMRVWGRKHGRVWRNRDDLATEIGFKGRRPLQRHLKALVEAGWIDRSYEPPNLDHSYPLYVLTLRDSKRGEDSCQCWFKCLCGKRQNRAIDQALLDAGRSPVSLVPQSQWSCRTTQGVALQNHPKEKDVEVETFGEGKAPEEGIEGRGGGVISKTCTSDETIRFDVRSDEGATEALHAVSQPYVRTALPDPEELPEKADGYGDVSRHGDDPPRRHRSRTPRPGPDDVFSGDGPPPKKKKKAKSGGRASKRSMFAKHGQPQWPPRTDWHSGYDVAAKWIEEMKLRHPDFAKKVPGGPDVGAGTELLDQMQDPDRLLSIMRVAIWDWPAIRETVEPWYTGGKDLPDPTHILKILTQLSGNVRYGIVSPAHRCSDYVARWIDGTWIDPRAPKPKGPSLAEQARARRGLTG